MKWHTTPKTLFLLFLLGGIMSCRSINENGDYLVKACNTSSGNCGYVNLEGDTIISPGKYTICFTDTFRIYAIVSGPGKDFMAIDRKENILYKVFSFDNGPDYPSDGLFRIIENNKIGFADSATGKVVIKPQFDCAWPFEDGVAKVSLNCLTQPDREHTSWVSDNWFYIDKTGKKVKKPKTKNL